MTFNIVSRYTWLYLLSSLQTYTHTHTHTHCQNKPEEDRCMHEWCSVTHCNHFNIGSVQFSGSVASNSFRPHGLQHARSPYPPPSPKICPISCPLHPWCHPAISSPDFLFSSPQSVQHQGLFQWVSCSYQVIKILELQLQYQSFQRVFRLPEPLLLLSHFSRVRLCATP